MDCLSSSPDTFRGPSPTLAVLAICLLAAGLSLALPASAQSSTPTPREKQNSELAVQDFQLEYATAREVLTVLRALLGPERVVSNATLNSVLVGGVPERLAIARRLVATQERPSAEVVLDVDLLAVEPRVLEAIRRRPGESGSPHHLLTEAELETLRRTEGVRVLASSALSVLEGGEARLVLGEAVPLSPALPAGDPPAGGAVPVSYQEIGLELSVGPQVHERARAVTLDIDLGLSGVVDTGTKGLPTVARRSLSTAVRLGDRQVCLLRGLMKVREATGRLAALPLLDAGAGADGLELVLAVTPHLIARDETATAALPAPLPGAAASPEGGKPIR